MIGLSIAALCVAFLALGVALLTLRARRPSQRPCAHGFEIIGVRVDADSQAATFDLRCVGCGAQVYRVVTQDIVAGLASNVGCSHGEAREALMLSGGDLAEAERRLLGVE
jgi:hypothetical protein